MPLLDQAPFLVLENMTLPLWGLHSTEALLLFAQMFPVFISLHFLGKFLAYEKSGFNYFPWYFFSIRSIDQIRFTCMCVCCYVGIEYI